MIVEALVTWAICTKGQLLDHDRSCPWVQIAQVTKAPTIIYVHICIYIYIYIDIYMFQTQRLNRQSVIRRMKSVCSKTK